MADTLDQIDYDTEIERSAHPENFEDVGICPDCGSDLSSTGYCYDCQDYPFNQEAEE